MQIALISPEFPPTSNWGGIATHNLSLVYLLVDMGHKVTIFSEKDNYSFLNESSIDYVPIKYKTANKLLNKCYYNPISFSIRSILKRLFPITAKILKWNMFSFFEILHYLKKNKINVDVIFTTDYLSPSLFLRWKLSKMKWLQHIHGPQLIFSEYSNNSLDKQFQKIIELVDFKIFRTNLTRLACSKQIVEIFLTKSIPILLVPRLYPHFEEKKNNASKLKELRAINKKSIIYYGRVEYRKGVDVLVKAFTKLHFIDSEFELHIIGNDSHDFGRMRNQPLLSQIKNHPAIYLYPFNSDKKALENLLSLLNGIIVIPSRFEPMGYAIIESMQQGRVVVTTANKEEIITDNVSGYISELDSNSLHKKLLEISKLPDKQIERVRTNAILAIAQQNSLHEAKKLYADLISAQVENHYK